MLNIKTPKDFVRYQDGYTSEEYVGYRAWLEPTSEVDSYIKVVCDNRYGTQCVDIDLKIADCNRSVDLFFNDPATCFEKLRRMQDALAIIEVTLRHREAGRGIEVLAKGFKDWWQEPQEEEQQ